MGNDSHVDIGVDVGGTFTDVVLVDGDQLFRAKSLTDHSSWGTGVLQSLRLAAAEAGCSLDDTLRRTRRLALATTAVTNVLATRTGPRTGLLTTAGHEDTVPLGRAEQFFADGWRVPGPQIVPRSRIVGVAERIDKHGAEISPLDVDEVLAKVAHLVDAHGIEALAISFLWSCRNPGHEQAAAAAISDRFPELVISQGAALSPTFREYERTMLAILNAYTSQAFVGVDAFLGELRKRGCQSSFHLAHSAAGVMGAAEARRFPLALTASGPAMGVVGAIATAGASGRDDLITCDMGGTSFDVSLVAGGVAARQDRGRLMGFWTALPRVAVESIGAGGGSIGWADALGILRVGPRSAGSDPGPACYGRGGSEPTVTDALVVLGYIDPDRFLGGAMPLERAAAVAACGRLAEPLGLDAAEAAWGIRQIALEGMIRAVRAIATEKGIDPRGYSMVSFGGCAGLFSAEIAAAMGIPTVLVPPTASVLSASGAATARTRRERAASVHVELPDGGRVLTDAFETLRAAVIRDLAADGISPGDSRVDLEAWMRFRRQPHELPVPITGAAGENLAAELEARFRAVYAARYGRGALTSSARIEVVTLRAIGTTDTPDGAAAATASGSPRPGHGAPSRLVAVERRQHPRPVATTWADALRGGDRVHGPALVDAADTTIWVPPGIMATMDDQRGLVLEVSP